MTKEDIKHWLECGNAPTSKNELDSLRAALQGETQSPYRVWTTSARLIITGPGAGQAVLRTEAERWTVSSEAHQKLVVWPAVNVDRKAALAQWGLA